MFVRERPPPVVLRVLFGRWTTMYGCMFTLKFSPAFSVLAASLATLNTGIVSLSIITDAVETAPSFSSIWGALCRTLLLTNERKKLSCQTSFLFCWVTSTCCRCCCSSFLGPRGSVWQVTSSSSSLKTRKACCTGQSLPFFVLEFSIPL